MQIKKIEIGQTYLLRINYRSTKDFWLSWVLRSLCRAGVDSWRWTS